MTEPRPAAEQSGGPSALPRPSSLKARIVTGIVLGVCAFLCILATSPWPMIGLLVIAVWFCTVEAAKMVEQPAWLWLIAIYLGVGLTLVVRDAAALGLAFGMMVVGLGALALRLARGGSSWLDSLAFGWIAGPMAAGAWLHGQTLASPQATFGLNALVLCLVPLWIGDTMAYTIGKTMGRTKMAPKISPKKTWEGSIANLIGCVVAAGVLGLAWQWPLMPCLAVGVAGGVFGQLGDLFQSMVKRAVNLKDSGDILPGHGGALDRVDSFLLACVPCGLVLFATYPQLFHVKR